MPIVSVASEWALTPSLWGAKSEGKSRCMRGRKPAALKDVTYSGSYYCCLLLEPWALLLHAPHEGYTTVYIVALSILWTPTYTAINITMLVTKNTILKVRGSGEAHEV